VIENKEVSVQQVFRADREGFLQIVSTKLQGADSVQLFLTNDKRALEAFVADDLSRIK
jgi:hypothetical protein